MLQRSCYTYTVISKLRSTIKENNRSVPRWCPQSPLRSCRVSYSPSPKDISPAVKVSDQRARLASGPKRTVKHLSNLSFQKQAYEWETQDFKQREVPQSGRSLAHSVLNLKAVSMLGLGRPVLFVIQYTLVSWHASCFPTDEQVGAFFISGLSVRKPLCPAFRVL